MAVSNLIKILQGVYQGHQSGQAPTVTAADTLQFGKKYTSILIPADAAAGTASEPTLLTVTPNYASGILVFGVWILPGAALTANGSNFASYQLGSRAQAGGGSQTTFGAAVTTASVSWVASSQVVLFTSTPGQAVAQNLQLTVAITKSGTGVVTPQSTFLVEWSEA